MTIEYEGKKYTVGNKYVICISNYLLRKNPNDTIVSGTTKVEAKLVLKKYGDGEMHSTYYHYGFVFEYAREWISVKRNDELTLPDALEAKK